jgi:hypothetical protein
MVFPTPEDAAAANTAFTGQIAALGGAGIPAFCHGKPCAVTHAVQGRFLYTTLAGPNSGAPGVKDPESIAASHSVAAYVLSRLLLLH